MGVSAEHTAKDQDGLVKGFRPEEAPGDIDKKEGEQPQGRCCGASWAIAGEPIAQHFFDGEIGAVKASPDDECPTGAVPEAADGRRLLKCRNFLRLFAG